MTQILTQLKDWYRKNEKKILDDFFTFLRFPSISTDVAYKSDVLNTANWLCQYLKEIGMKAELWQTSGYPVVFATHLTDDPKSPTILLYHHYDVQPVDPLDLWKSPPFEPVLKGNAVFARGASDNKGQCFYTITALKGFLELAKEAKVNIKLFIEGEEESGGVGTFEILEKKKEALKADHLLVVDAGLREAGEPAVTLGVRGILAMQLECKNSKIDLHSGSHGGIALNPNRALVTALAQLWDRKGRVQVPGFYDDVIEPTQEELEEFDMRFDLKKYQESFGVKAFANEQGSSLPQSNLLRPTLELNGIGGGYTGHGFKTVIPSKAIAKISCRLVPNQDPERICDAIAHYLRTQLPEGIELKAEFDHGAKAFRSSPSAPIVKISARAYEEVLGSSCHYLLCGASIPIVGALTEASGAETALIGMGLDEDDIHAPNEHFGIDRFENGVYLIAEILDRLSQC
jgi:acetylornithine deacetylase/succinyl-diaminopimelate desuccinylase-like protein